MNDVIFSRNTAACLARSAERNSALRSFVTRSALTIGFMTAGAAAFAGAPKPNVDVTVTNAATFSRAVEAAKSGDIIRLAPGTYGDLAVTGLNITTGTVRITSLNTAQPAVVTSFLVDHSSGLAIDTLSINAIKTTKTFPFTVANSNHIALDNLTAVGDGYGPNPTAVSAIILRDGTDLSLTRSRISSFWHGVTMLNITNARIADNELRDLRTDGIRGGGVSNSIIEGNVETNFHPIPIDHPDGIQLWTDGQKQSASNVIIRYNLVDRGTGGATQGIFIRDVVGGLPFLNMQVYGNLVIGTRYNGIAIDGIVGGQVHDNQVVSYPDIESWLRIQNGSAVALDRNVASKFPVLNATLISNTANTILTSYLPSNAPALIKVWASQPGPAQATAGNTLLKSIAP